MIFNLGTTRFRFKSIFDRTVTVRRGDVIVPGGNYCRRISLFDHKDHYRLVILLYSCIIFFIFFMKYAFTIPYVSKSISAGAYCILARTDPPIFCRREPYGAAKDALHKSQITILCRPAV